MSRPTRLVLVAPHGGVISDRELDLDGIPNANAQSPISIIVQQQCDLGHWHQMGRPRDLPLYDGVEPPRA